jgi:dipeptidyl aminopeptidase/acylaminoacyl peptidase
LALKSNDVYNWKPSAPVKLYQGDKDIQVPTFNSTLAEQTLRQLGANVQLVWLTGKDHTSAFPAAIAQSIVWFNTL